MSTEASLFKALESMTREYSKNPSKQLKNRIDAARDRYNRLRAQKGKKPVNSKLKIRGSRTA
jgi:predicted ATPase with chaperone activity